MDTGEIERFKPISTFEASRNERIQSPSNYWIGNEKEDKRMNIKQEETYQLCITKLSA